MTNEFQARSTIEDDEYTDRRRTTAAHISKDDAGAKERSPRVATPLGIAFFILPVLLLIYFFNAS